MRNRYLALSWITLALLTGGAMFAQTAEEIITKHIAARGGAENWAKVQSMKMTGTYSSFSTPHPFTLWRKRPDLYRFDHNLAKWPVTVAYDGRKCWQINPLYGTEDATSIPDADSLVVLRDKDFESILFSYAAQGQPIEYLGEGEVEGQPCHRLKVTLPDSTEETWYLDRETYLEVKVEGRTYDFGRQVSLEAYFDDFREVEGVLIPFYQERQFETRYRVYTVDAVEINLPVDDALFVMPDKSAEDK